MFSATYRPSLPPSHKRRPSGYTMDFIHADLVCRRADPAIIPAGFRDRIKMLRELEDDNKSFRARTPVNSNGKYCMCTAQRLHTRTFGQYFCLHSHSGLILVVPVCILLPIVPVRFCPDAGAQKHRQHWANMTTISHCAIPPIDAYHLYVPPRYSSALE